MHVLVIHGVENVVIKMVVSVAMDLLVFVQNKYLIIFKINFSLVYNLSDL